MSSNTKSVAPDASAKLDARASAGEGSDATATPDHIAIIMDGNNR